MLKITCVIIVCVVCVLITANCAEFSLERRVCYFANWAPYRDITPILYPDAIDSSLCTHIHYAFAKIDAHNLTLVPTEEHDMNWTDRSKMPLYIRLYGLKRRNMAIKILLAVGGWSARSKGFNEATRTKTNREKFIVQAIKFLREWNFDGIDLDWEYVGDATTGADSNSKENFNALLSEFRLAVNSESEVSGKRRLLIASAVAADPKKVQDGYNVTNLCTQLDYVSVMTYDFYGGGWDVQTGLNSPLYGKTNSNASIIDWKNVNYTIYYWINNGCTPYKLNIGLAAYGRSFTLKNSSLNRIGAPSLKSGYAGPFTREDGVMAYFEICEKIRVENWTRYWDDEQQSNYATLGDQWIGYDDKRAIALKVKWASTMLLGGTMLWTLDFDDYNGQFCEEGPFPIAQTIKQIFDEQQLITNDSNQTNTSTINSTTISSTIRTTSTTNSTKSVFYTITSLATFTTETITNLSKTSTLTQQQQQQQNNQKNLIVPSLALKMHVNIFYINFLLIFLIF